MSDDFIYVENMEGNEFYEIIVYTQLTFATYRNFSIVVKPQTRKKGFFANKMGKLMRLCCTP